MKLWCFFSKQTLAGTFQHQCTSIIKMFCCLLFINKHNNGTLSTTKEIVSPVFHDLWGYPIPWTIAEWNDQKRKDLVQSTLKTKVSFFHMYIICFFIIGSNAHLSLFGNKRLMHDEMTSQNASKFAIFLEYENPYHATLFFP